ncbi:MAG: hypothetical protein IJU16_06260 [Clostridia bacterium]|nr:hypothetical protein [Clostridia bacterium]
MKRVITAAVLLVLVAAVSVGSVVVECHVADRLLQDCDALEAAFDDGDPQLTQAAAAFAESAEQATGFFPYFVYHGAMDTLLEEARALSALATIGDRAGFAEALARVRARLTLWITTSRPLPENIF